MKKIHKILCAVFAVILCISVIPVTASAAGSWVGSWSTSPLRFGIAVGSGVYTDVITPRTTVRTTITPTLSGNSVRLKFSNLYGDSTLSISEVTIAKTGTTADEIDTSTVTQVTFNNGSKSVNIAKGREVYTDTIKFPVNALEKVSISVYYEKNTPITTAGLSGGVSYCMLGGGNRTHSKNLTALATKLDINASTITYHNIPFFINLDVVRTDDAYSVVIIGDSTVTNDTYLFLATKLIKNGITNVGVLNQAIIGNRVLYDGASALGHLYGVSLVNRFQKDALDQAGCKYIIVKEGVNDILHPMTNSMKGIAPYASVDDIIGGYKTIANAAKAAGKNIYLVTRTAYKGYQRDFFLSSNADLVWSQEGQNMIDGLNKWIRSSDCLNYYNGIVDASKMADPKDYTKLRDHFTLDGAHFSTYGQIAFADMIPAECLGVDGNLKTVASILDIDPYTPPKTNTSADQGGSEGSDSGFLAGLLGGFTDLMAGVDTDSLGQTATDALSGAMDTIGSLIPGIGSSDNGSSSNQGVNPNTGLNITPISPIVPQANADTNAGLNVNQPANTNVNQNYVADIQSSQGGVDASQTQTSTSASLTPRRLTGIMLISGVGVLLVIVALVVLANKDKGAGSVLTRSARKLRI